MAWVIQIIHCISDCMHFLCGAHVLDFSLYHFNYINKTYIYISSSVPCSNYTNISDPWRNVGFCSSSYNKSDINLMEGWYRFTGIGGDQVVSSCAPALNNISGNKMVYSLFTYNSTINYTSYITCSEGFTVYYLQPTERTYATREENLCA